MNDRYSPRYPTFRQVGRTGATRYTPTVKSDKYGRVFIYNSDPITIQEYDEMRFDGQIRAGLLLLKLPIIQAKWSVSSSDKDVSAFVQECLKPIWPTFVRQMLLAFDFGFSVFEICYKRAYNLKISQTQGQLDDAQSRVYKHATVLDKMLHLDPLTLYLLGERRTGDFAGVRQYIPDAGLIPKDKCFILSNDHEYQEWYGISRMRPCYPYYIYGKLMYEFTNVFYETYSVPSRIGRYPVGRTDLSDDPDTPQYVANDEYMLNLVEEMRNNHAIVLPSDIHDEASKMYKWDVQPWEANRSGGDQLAYINHLELMKLKSLLVPQLALEIGGSGSYGLAEQQIKFFMMNTQASMTQIEDAINQFIIPNILFQNFGVNAPSALFKFQPVNDEMTQALQQTFLQTIGSGQPIPMKDGAAMMIDMQWLAESLGMPVHILQKHEVEEYVAGVQMMSGAMQQPDQTQQQPEEEEQQDPNQPPPRPQQPNLSEIEENASSYRAYVHNVAKELYDWNVVNGEIVCTKKRSFEDLVAAK